jgi:cardiolipin synthase
MPAALRPVLDPRARDPTARLPRALRSIWRRTLDRLLPLGGSSDGNQVTCFFDGDACYDAMLAAIGRAQSRVWLETYIFEPDKAGRAFLAALAAAAARGADVLLLVDAIGSPRLDEATLAPLRAAGVQVAHYNPPWSLKRRLPLLHRDHRKILVVDEVAFAGGMNISEDYAGARWGNGLFRDTHALVEGPAVADLAAILRASFRAATGRELSAPPRRAAMPDGVFVQVLGSDVRRQKRHIQRALYQTVGRCVSTCFLTSPYFVPPPRLLRALVRAARRGVDVRVLTAGLSDVPVAAVAARHLYGTLLQAGVKVYEMHAQTLHAKTAAIDGIYASIGSFNLDRWSFVRNSEVNVTVLDSGLASLLEAQMAVDLGGARQVSRGEHAARSLWERARGWLALQLMRL